MRRAACWAELIIYVTLLLPSARAQPLQGLYVGSAAGGNFAPPFLAKDDGTKLYTNPGAVAALSVG
jgi:hypothetical protein